MSPSRGLTLHNDAGPAAFLQGRSVTFQAELRDWYRPQLPLAFCLSRKHQRAPRSMPIVVMASASLITQAWTNLAIRRSVIMKLPTAS